MKKYKGIALLTKGGIPVRIDIPEKEDIGYDEELHTAPCEILIDDSKEGIREMNKNYTNKSVLNRLNKIQFELHNIFEILDEEMKKEMKE